MHFSMHDLFPPTTTGLSLEDGPNKDEARSLLALSLSAFGPSKTRPLAITTSPNPFHSHQTNTVQSVVIWKKSQAGWTYLGRVPPIYVHGGMPRNILAFVRFFDNSGLFFQRHPKKNAAGDNTSFLHALGLPFRVASDLDATLPTFVLDRLWDLFAPRHAALLQSTHKPPAQTPLILPTYGSLSFPCEADPALHAHDQAIKTLLKTALPFFIPRVAAAGVTHFSYTLIGRRITASGTKTPFQCTLVPLPPNVGQSLAQRSLVEALVVLDTTLTALSDGFALPQAGLCYQSNGMQTQQAWLNIYVDTQDPQHDLSGHTMVERLRTLEAAGMDTRFFTALVQETTTVS